MLNKNCKSCKYGFNFLDCPCPNKEFEDDYKDNCKFWEARKRKHSYDYTSEEKLKVIEKIMLKNMMLVPNELIENIEDLDFPYWDWDIKNNSDWLYEMQTPNPKCKYKSKKRLEVVNELENCKQITLKHIMDSAKEMSVDDFEKLLKENMKGNGYGKFHRTSYNAICIAIKKLRHHEIGIVDLAWGYCMIEFVKEKFNL